MNNEIEKIRSIIKTKVQETKAIDGGALGNAIKQSFPDLKMKSYGGIKKFISDYCKGEVEWVRKAGGDDLYKAGGDDIYKDVSVPFQDSNSSEGMKSLIYKETTIRQSKPFWQAFSNPRVDVNLFVDKNTGQLFLSDSDEFDVSSSIKIEKVTPDEYKQIALEFLPMIEEPLKTDFSQALSYNDFWQHWSELLKANKKDGIYKKWVNWRGQKVTEIYESRLAHINLPAAILEDALVNLNKKQSSLSVKSESAEARKIDQVKKSTPLREIINGVIGKLTEEELRRVWLPSGLLIDELKKHKN